jgi:hypothetical protein
VLTRTLTENQVRGESKTHSALKWGIRNGKRKANQCTISTAIHRHHCRRDARVRDSCNNLIQTQV